MDKVKIKVINPTGANKIDGELCLKTGIVSIFTNGETHYSHISEEAADGWSVVKVEDKLEAPASTEAPKEEPKIEEKPVERSVESKPKKKKK